MARDREVEEARGSHGALAALHAYLRTFAHLRPNARRLLLATACVNVGVGIFGVLFNLYLVALGYTLVFVGLVAAVSTVGQAIVAPGVAWALRRAGARAVMAAGTAVMAVALAVSALFGNAAVLLVASAISGAAFSVSTIPAYPYMMEHSTARERSHLFSAYFASTSIGSMIGSLLSGAVPPLAALLARSHGHNSANAVLGNRLGLLVGAVATGVGVWLLWSMQEREEATAEDTERLALPAADETVEMRLRDDVLVMLGATALIALSMGAIMPFFNVYFATRLHAGTATIGTIYALSGVVCTVAAFLAPAVGRWGRLEGFSATRLLTAPVFLLFWLHPGLAVAAAAYIGRNILGTISGALENTFGMEVIPARLRGTVASWRIFAFNTGWTVGSVLAGFVVSRLGYDAVFVAGAGLTMFGSLAYFARYRTRFRARR